MSRLIKAGSPLEQARIAPLHIASLGGSSPRRRVEAAAFAPLAAGAENCGTPSPVRPNPQAPGAAQPTIALERRRELEEEIASLRQQLDRAREETDQREESAFERGLREGREEAADHSEKRNALLAEALKGLQQDQSARIAEMELLALQLVRAALGRIIGDPGQRSALIANSVAHHLTHIRRDLVLALRVSAEDFAETEQWSALTEACPAIALERDSSLASGECIADLKLGTLDLGLSGQWQRLCELFESLAETEPRP